jgi:hypothetical protein
MEEIAFAKPVPGHAYVPFTPDCVKAIEQPQRPPLLHCEAEGAPAPSAAEFTVNGLTFRVALHFTCRDEDMEIPLAMCAYLKTTDENLFDKEACLKCDLANISRERHNKFLAATFNEFIKGNDVGTSAGKLTAPQPPIDSSAARLDAIRKLTSDKYETAKKAIAYLAPFALYCGRDFEFDGALRAANDKAYEQAINLRIEKGKGRVRVNVEGRRPCWWDGVSPRDENGGLVQWEMGDGHTFLTPELRIVAGREEQALVAVSAAEVGPKEERPNPFDALKIPSVSSQLLTITDS